MSHKTLVRMSILTVLLLTAALIPLQVQAGGVCGGAYTVEKGDTIDKLAAMCGTSATAILAANPGIANPLTVGQVINIPGANYGVTVTPVPVTTATTTPVPPPVVVNNYNTYNYYNYYNPLTPVATYNNSYIVQYGDTFSGIAARFGVSIPDLWAANPNIWDINFLYTGQVLYIPNPSYWNGIPAGNASSSNEPTALTYNGTIPKNAPSGTVKLVNKSNAEVYISLRTTRADGTNAIHEYPVGSIMYADLPAGWTDYVAWVGGVKYTGGFKMGEGDNHMITFNRSKVVVD